MIKLAFELPIRYLRMLSKMTDYDYVLAHLVEKNQEYRDFYRDQSSRGRYVILDNSVFELDKPLGGYRLIEIAKTMKSSCVIAPDILKDGPKTEQKAFEFVDMVKSSELNIEIMAVAQGNTLEEWLHCYEFLAALDGIYSIGLPFDIHFFVPSEVMRKSQTQQWMEKRIKLIEFLILDKKICKEKPHHLLGASDCVEYRFLKKYPFITTADTSSPVVHGINGILYKDYGLPCEKIKKKLDFDSTLTKKQINTINKNIQIVKRFSR